MIPSIVFVDPFALVRPKPVDWLWPSFIPLGMLSVLDGDPGLGKSTMLLDLAARLSRGQPMPDGSKPRRAATIILSAEDDPERVIRPRLDAAGADVDRIFKLSLGTADEASRDLAVCLEDMKHLEAAIAENGVGLVIIDPLVAYLPAQINANRDQDVRRALALLKRVAEDTSAAIVAIRHLNKRGDSTNSVYRGGGSIGIIGAARAGLLVARDPDDEDRRILAATKMNLAPMPPSYAFRLRTEPGAAHPRVNWDGVSEHRADALLAAPQTDQERGAQAEAERFLRETLTEWRTTREVMRGSRELGISERTLFRARQRLGVVARKVGQPGGQQHWELNLPKNVARSQHGSLGSLLKSNGATTASEDDLTEGSQDFQQCQPGEGPPSLDGREAFDEAIRDCGFNPVDRP